MPKWSLVVHAMPGVHVIRIPLVIVYPGVNVIRIYIADAMTGVGWLGAGVTMNVNVMRKSVVLVMDDAPVMHITVSVIVKPGARVIIKITLIYKELGLMNRYVIHVTKNCNMDCKYCYETDKTSGDRDWPSTKKILDNILSTNREVEIEFLGGEPLLNFDLIKQAVNYLAMSDVNIRYYISTNGTVMSPTIIEFLTGHTNFYVGISLDGTRFANQLRVFKDSSRNSYQTVLKNLLLLIESLGTERVMVHMVTHPYNIGSLSASIDFLYKEGVRMVDIGIVENTLPLTEEYQTTFISEHSLVSDRILKNKYPGLVVTSLQFEPYNGYKEYLHENGVVVAEKYVIDQAEVISCMRIPYKLRQIVYSNHKQKEALLYHG